MARKSHDSEAMMKARNILRESALHLAQLQAQLTAKGRKPTAAQRRDYAHRLELLETAACDYAALKPRDTAAATAATRAVRKVLTSAERHGEQGEPEQEVGDLQAFIYALAPAAGPAAVLAACTRFWDENEEW